MSRRFMYPMASFGAGDATSYSGVQQGIYFQSDYESTGDITSTYKNTPLPSQFQNADAAITINSTAPYVYSGTYSTKLHYQRAIPGDVDHALTIYVSSPTDEGSHPAGNGITEWYCRWYEYFRDPSETGGDPDNLQRKNLYVWADTGSPSNLWAFFVTSDGNTNNNMPLRIGVQNSPLGGTSYNIYPTADGVNATILSFNTWYKFEMYVKNDTTSVTWGGSSWSGEANGIMQYWINDVPQILISNTYGAGYVDIGTKIPLNLGSVYGGKLFHIGYAADSGVATISINEDRYVNLPYLASSR